MSLYSTYNGNLAGARASCAAVVCRRRLFVLVPQMFGPRKVSVTRAVSDSADSITAYYTRLPKRKGLSAR